VSDWVQTQIETIHLNNPSYVTGPSCMVGNGLAHRICSDSRIASIHSAMLAAARDVIWGGGAWGHLPPPLNRKIVIFCVFAYKMLIFYILPPLKEVGQNCAPPGKKLK